MDSFYGGRKGQDFAIKLIFDNKVALENDLKQRWQSPVGVGDYVLVSYGLVSDGEKYSKKIQPDLDKWGKSYNSTLWQKVYLEDEYTGESEISFLDDKIKKGLGYVLITSMTGNTPRFVKDVTVIPVSPDTPPSAEIDNTDVDQPKLKLTLPKAQYMTITNDAVDANEQPTLTWQDTFVDTDGKTKKLDNPTLILHLPLSQVIHFNPAVVEDASTLPSMDWDATDDGTKTPGDRTNKVNSPELTLHIPQSQVLKNEHVTILPQDINQVPSVELVTTGNNDDGTKKINQPELIFKLPIAQNIDWLGLVDVLPAGSEPEIVWDETDISTEPDGSTANTLNRPKLGFKLPKGQAFRNGPEGIQVRFTDAGKAPSVSLDATGTWADGTSKVDEPGLIFTLPLSQKINFLGWKDSNILDANEKPRVEWKDTDNLAQDGVQSDLNNTPTLEFFLPQSQVLQKPTQVAVGPTIEPSVKDIGTVNEPKYEFSLPKAVKFYMASDLNQTSTTYYIASIPDARYDNMEVGDYLINDITGFIYRVSEKTSTTIRFTYEARFAMYVPETGEETTTAFSKDDAGEWKRNEVTVEKKFLDSAQTKVQFLFTIPNQPRFEFTVTPLAPAETMGISQPSIKDELTITQDLKIPRGSRIFASKTASTLGENGDVWINSETGDLYNHDGTGWGSSVGNIKGPKGDALNIVDSFDYDNITEGTVDTLDTVSALLERDLGAGNYPKPDQLIKVTWTQKDISTKNVLSETSYWYFYIPDKGWERAQVTAGLGDVIANIYSSYNEDNKTYSIGYINSLIDDNATIDLDKKTYSIQKINRMTSWQDLTSGLFAPLQLYKGTALPTTIKEGNMYLITVRDQGRDIGNNLFVDISNSQRVQISASKLSKPVADGSGGTSYIVVEAEDVVAKSKIANAAENAVLVGAARNIYGTYDVKAIPNMNGAFYSDGLAAPKFGTLPLSAGGLGATTAKGGRDTLEVYSQTETEDLISWGSFADLI